jgi:hypothetical protein
VKRLRDPDGVLGLSTFHFIDHSQEFVSIYSVENATQMSLMTAPAFIVHGNTLKSLARNMELRIKNDLHDCSVIGMK